MSLNVLASLLNVKAASSEPVEIPQGDTGRPEVEFDNVLNLPIIAQFQPEEKLAPVDIPKLLEFINANADMFSAKDIQEIPMDDIPVELKPTILALQKHFAQKPELPEINTTVSKDFKDVTSEVEKITYTPSEKPAPTYTPRQNLANTLILNNNEAQPVAKESTENKAAPTTVRPAIDNPEPVKLDTKESSKININQVIAPTENEIPVAPVKPKEQKATTKVTSEPVEAEQKVEVKSSEIKPVEKSEKKITLNEPPVKQAPEIKQAEPIKLDEIKLTEISAKVDAPVRAEFPIKPAIQLAEKFPVIAKEATISVDKKETITIQLKPDHLGKVEITMEISKSGHVQTHIVADKPEAIEHLQRDAKVLQQSLNEAGYKTDENSLSFNLKDHQQQQQKQQSRIFKMAEVEQFDHVIEQTDSSKQVDIRA